LNEAIVATIAAIGHATDSHDDRIASQNIILLTTAAAVDVCVVMRREGRGTGQTTHPQCMVYTAPATGTDTAVLCQTKHRHQPSYKFLSP